MSEREKFFDRWSRRKQEAENEAKLPDAKEPKPDTADPSLGEMRGESSVLPGQAKKDQPVFDPKSLPSLDSIAATTDIRAFLAAGVPEELKQAALQRVWRTDPAIRDFVGLSENSWDFNDPNGIHGFGPLEVTEQMKAAVEAMFDRKPPSPEPAVIETEQDEQPEPERPAALAQREDEDEIIDQISESRSEEPVSEVDVALRKTTTKDENVNDPNIRRAHGGALPK
jgi:hypothetical protein